VDSRVNVYTAVRVLGQAHRRVVDLDAVLVD
jgi:hypothetical protein